MTYTYHLLALPHTKVTKEYSACAFTQKILNMQKMLGMMWKKFYLYAPGWNDVVNTLPEYENIYSDDFTNGFDWDNDIGWNTYTQHTIEAIKSRLTWKDILLVSYGYRHKPIIDALQLPAIEMWIWYPASMLDTYRVYESYACMYYHYWMQQQKLWRAYDTVIPNYFDTQDFTYKVKPKDYFLYIWRSSRDKGRHIAVDVAKNTGIKVIFAWQAQQAIIEAIKGTNCECVGVVNTQQRNKLMSEAQATFVPSQYIEPFAWVHVESMMCWTPVITSDNWVFNETNIHGVTWYRCLYLHDYIDATRKIKSLSRKKIHEYATNRFGLDTIQQKYKLYYDRIENLLDWWWRYNDIGMSTNFYPWNVGE